MSGDRVVVFIDGQNLYHSCERALKRTDINIGGLASVLVGDRRLVRTYYYNCPLPTTAPPDRIRKQAAFFEALQSTPYLELRKGQLVDRTVKCAACGDERKKQMEKGVDMYIGVDMVGQAAKNLYDVAILVSGDRDLLMAAQMVKDLGKHVEIAMFPNSCSVELKKAADVYRPLKPLDFSSANLYLPKKPIA